MWALLILGAALAYLAFRSGGSDPANARVAAFAVACVAAVHFLKTRHSADAPQAAASLRWPLMLLAGYLCFQIVPLPMPVVSVLSPARAELLRAAAPAFGGKVSFAPLAVAPAASLQALVLACATILVLLLIREILWKRERVWIAVAPIVAIAAVEAVLGCLQAWFGGAGEARGTWPNRNHYASFLAMCLSFPAMYGIARLQNSRLPGRRRLSPVVVACMAFFTAALLLLGNVESLSRMGFTAAIFSLFVAGIAAGGKPNKWTSSARRRLAVAGALLAIVVVAFLFLAPAPLISRFDQLEFSNGITTEDRFQLWHESLALVRAYPVFGTGLGGYESVFLQHKVSSPMVSDKFAHNDYLQYFIELGAIGFVLAAVALASVLFGACRTLSHPSAEHRAMAAACCGSFAAILLHSAVDFNLQIPANQFLLAWVAGLACSSSLRYSPLPMDVPAARPLRRAPVEVPARTSIVSLSMSAWSKGNQPQTPQEV